MTNSEIPFQEDDFVPVTAGNLAILILDGSGSMLDLGKTGKSKSEEVKGAAKGLLSRLKKSEIRNTFWLSVLAFDVKVEPIIAGYRSVTEISEDEIIAPTDVVGGGMTNIHEALIWGHDIAQKFLNDSKIPGEYNSKKVIIFLLSDGMHNSGDDPREIAMKIKNKQITIVTVAYGNQADRAMLRDLSSGKEFYLETSDPERLREFFISTTLALNK